MEIRVLRYFLAVAQQRNISKAADTLHIAQPSLSRQIKELEEELGVQLFIRGNRQITLTSAGYYLLDRAEEIVSLTDKTIQNLQSTESLSGQLYLGAGENLAMARIVKVLDALMVRHPNINVHFYTGTRDDIEAKLASGVLDFGVITGTRQLDHFSQLILPERNEYGVVLPANASLARKAQLTAADLISSPLVVSSQALFQEKFRNWWGQLYPQVNIVATGNSAFNPALMAQHGHALLITYRDLLDANQPGLTFRPLSPRLTDSNALFWKQDAQLSPVAQRFLAMLDASRHQPNFLL